MAWFKKSNFISSIQAMFAVSTAKTPAVEEHEDIVEEIRSRMAAMASVDPSETGRGLVRRIRYAPDIHALWFIRIELMALLAHTHGEAVARERLERLGILFARLLPEGLRSRPSPLGHHEERTDRGPT
jgi:hypothetical protein